MSNITLDRLGQSCPEYLDALFYLLPSLIPTHDKLKILFEMKYVCNTETVSMVWHNLFLSLNNITMG